MKKLKLFIAAAALVSFMACNPIEDLSLREQYVVKAGTPILRLDLPLLEKRHINLISPVLIVNYDKVRRLATPERPGERVAAGEDTVLEYAV